MDKNKHREIIRDNILFTAAFIIMMIGLPALIYDLNYEGDWAGLPSFFLLILLIIPILLFIYIPWIIWFVIQYIKYPDKAFVNNKRGLGITIIVFIYIISHYILMTLLKW